MVPVTTLLRRRPPASAARSLRRDALGLPALFFCIATAAAPMTAVLFNVPILVAGAAGRRPRRSSSPCSCCSSSRSATSR